MADTQVVPGSTDGPGPLRSRAASLGRGCRVGAGLAAFAFLLAACAAVDTPDACRLTHVADLPIRMVAGLPVVEVQVAGKPLRLLLDTGADSLVVTPETVERLGLDLDYARPGYMVGLGAQASHWPTKPVAIQLGSATVEPKSLIVGTVLPGSGRTAPDGLIGGAVLAAYDLDVDIPRRRLSLYQRRRCPSGPAPFPGPSLSVQASPVGPFRLAVPVSLDGRTLSMLVDTGATPSSVDAAASGLSDVELGADQTARMVTADPVGLAIRFHTFRTLALGSEVVGNPVLAVGPVAKPGFSGLLGTDYWRSHRLWISYGSGTVFVGLPPPQRDRP